MAPTARRKSSPSAAPGAFGTLVWIITRIGIPLALVLGLLWWRIDAAVRHGIEEASPYAQITRGGTFFWFNGDVGVTQLTITPRVNNPQNSSISAERLTVHTPGLYWLVSTSLFGLREPPQRIGLTMQNLEGANLPHAPGSDWIGLYSASPFEAEGCSANDWTRSDLSDMGLPRKPALLTWMIEFPTPSEAKATWDWQTEGVGSAQGTANLKFAGNVVQSQSALASGELSAAKLSFDDHGFVPARNRYCAGRLHVAEAAFVDRHLAAVQRVLMSHGVAAGTELEQLYRAFATKGGQMEVQLRPQTMLSVASLSTLTKTNWLDMLSPIVSLNGGTPVLLALTPVARVPLGPEGDALLAARQQPDSAAVAANPPGDQPQSGAKPQVKPELVKVAAGTPASPVAAPVIKGAARPGQAVEYADLEHYVGERILVRTILDTERIGTLAKFNAISLTLNFDNGAVMTIPANSVRSAMIAPTAATTPPGTGTPRAKKN
jgi:hypothetical protein